MTTIEGKYLITGARGFIGKHILKSLAESNVHTLGRSLQNQLQFDIADNLPVLDAHDVVIHAAGKAHSIPQNKEEEESFFKINQQGTLNLLKALENHPPKQFIHLSTVAVYGRDVGELLTEDTVANPKGPYAESKWLAEQAVQSWCEERGVANLILRLPLVIGEDAPGNWGAISKAIAKGRYVRIKGNKARKSAVLASDVAQSIVNWVGQSGVFNLSDGQHPYFHELEDALAERYEKPLRFQLPLSWLSLGAKVGGLLKKMNIPFPLDEARLHKMTTTLTFSDQKAREELNWQPTPVLEYLRSYDTNH